MKTHSQIDASMIDSTTGTANTDFSLGNNTATTVCYHQIINWSFPQQQQQGQLLFIGISKQEKLRQNYWYNPNPQRNPMLLI